MEQKSSNNDDKLFKEYVNLVKQRRDVKRRHSKKVFRAIDKKWQELPYSLSDTFLLFQSKTFIYEADLNVLKKIFRQARIPLSSKEKKSGGRDAIYTKFKKNYYKPTFQQFFEDYYAALFEPLALTMQTTPSIASLKDVLLDHNFETVVYFAEKSQHKNKWHKFFKKHSLQSYTKCLIDLYSFSIQEKVEKILQKQPQIRLEKKDMKSFKKEIDRLKQHGRKLEKSEKSLRAENIQLKNEVNHLKQANENHKKKMAKLMQENDATLSSFIKDNEEQVKKEKRAREQEVHDIKKKMKDELEYYNEQIKLLVKEVERAYKQQGDELSQENKDEITLDLFGKKVAFIGGNQSKNYISKVKEYNGEMRFVPVDDYNLIPGAISNCDVVFFLTEVAGHKHYRCIMKETKRNGTPLRYINSRGLTSFERELKEYIVELNADQLAGNQ